MSLAEERDRRHQGTGVIRRAVTRACRSDLSTDPWSRPNSVRAWPYVTLSRGKGRDR